MAAKNSWQTLFTSPKWILSSPAEEVVAFYLKYLENPGRQLQKRTLPFSRSIHDLGCGGGRHVTYFAELGFSVTGSDISSNAVAHTKEELARRGLTANVVESSMTELPFPDKLFDVTLTRAAINHATMAGLKKTVYEMARTTKPGGLLFVTLSSERSSEWRKGEEVERDVTYIPSDGPEAGLVHTFFSATNAAALLEPFFRIEELYLSEHTPLITDAPDLQDSDQYFGSEYVIVGVRRNDS
jgi:SAM-dependent methyltransferase